jgi:hypothetical protein
MWVTGNGYIRQELLPDNAEARGAKKSACTGRYKITGDYIYPIVIGKMTPASLPMARSKTSTCCTMGDIFFIARSNEHIEGNKSKNGITRRVL